MEKRTIDFLTHLWRGGKASYWWGAQDSRSHWFNTTAQWREVPDASSTDVYFGVNPCKFIPARPSWSRTKLSSIAAINVLYCDIDDYTNDIRELYLPHTPSAVISSGNGKHCYWLLKKPLMIDSLKDLQYAKYLQRWWAHSIPSADSGVCCLTRILRLPGTLNHKAEPKPVAIDQMDLTIQYDIEELGIPDMPPEPVYARVEIERVHTGEEAQRLVQCAYDNLAHAAPGDRNKQCYSQSYFMGRLVGAGMVTQTEAHELLADAAHRNGVGGERETDTVRSIKRGLREGMRDPFDVNIRRKAVRNPEWDQ